MKWINDLLVYVGLREAPKPKRKYVRKTPAAPRKPRAEKKASEPVNMVPKQPPWSNGQVDASTIKDAVGQDHVGPR